MLHVCGDYQTLKKRKKRNSLVTNSKWIITIFFKKYSYLCNIKYNQQSRLHGNLHNACPVIESINFSHFLTRCDMGGDCECLCTAIANFAEKCNELGAPVRWRHQRLCRKWISLAQPRKCLKSFLWIHIVYVSAMPKSKHCIRRILHHYKNISLVLVKYLC